jgi:hypothetical protein
MSNEFLETPLLEASAKDESEDYSEWRLLRLGCLFDGIEVNTGFQVRDFQTNHGTSVVDPEIYCKLLKEANSIWWSVSFCPFMVLVSFLVICESMIFFPVLLAVGPVASMILFCLLLFPVFIVLYGILNARAANRTHTLVDSYKEHFLKEYGVELGYSRFTTTRGEDGAFVVPGIYLRRPRTSREEKDFGDSFPPIFIDRTIPGDVDLFRTANLDLTVADAKACSLLRSTYLEEVKIQPSPVVGYILDSFLIISIMLWLFAALDCAAMIMACYYVLGFAFVLLLVLMVMDETDIGNRKALQARRQCQEVARLVTEALQSDKDIAGTLSVEFSTSQLPGRDTQQCRRFQFVRHGTAPSIRNEMTDVSGCV